MEIDSRFCINIHYITIQGQSYEITISASKFFEWEDYDKEDWDRFLPWKHVSLNDYLPQNAIDIYEITASIFDEILKREQRIVVRNLLSSKVILSWNDVTSNPEIFELILDIPAVESPAIQVARIDVNNGETKLNSHSLIEGDSMKAL